MSARGAVDGRMVIVVLLAAWLGAATIVAAVVAPAAFAVLPSRTLAGALVGRVLPTLFWSGAAVGVAAAFHSRRTRNPSAFTTALAAAAMSLVAQVVIAPRIESVRASAGGAIDALASDDMRRVAFGRLHGMSVALLGLACLAALASLVYTARFAPGSSSLNFRTSHDHG